MSISFQRIAVFGPGLLGGSVAKAIRKASPDTEVRVWGRRMEPVEVLVSAGIADFGSTEVGEVSRDCDLLILATPVEHMASLVKQIAESNNATESAIITDVGSVKGGLVEQLEGLCSGRGMRFIGSHPMAGSDKTGVEHSTDDLFEGATTIVTRSPSSDDQAFELVSQFWSALGSRISELDPDEHDRMIAKVSHLPHVMAAVLVNVALSGEEKDAALHCGNGFRDTTRIAGGSPELWTGILSENADQVSSAVESMISELEEFRSVLDGLDKEGLRRFLSRSRNLRKSLDPS